MAEPNKKRESLESRLGRPFIGALSTYSKRIRTLITKMRSSHEGWGAASILVELELVKGYKKSELPSVDAVNRYLKEQGFVKERIPFSKLPLEKCKTSVRYNHELWEMDAEGSVFVKGLGYVSNINIKDSKSKVHCMAFPVHVKGQMSQPKTDSYLWALRLAFEEWGLPKTIQVDRDSVFIANHSKSPFPSQVYLWLLGLGVNLCFIDVPPPQKQAMVERSHQTINKQTIKGQNYECWKRLFQFTNERRDRLNKNLPNRLLGGKPPLVAFPKAVHSGRFYSIEQEKHIFDIRKVYKYLAKCCWYRKLTKVKTISLHGEVYYLKNLTRGIQVQVQIKFCNRAKRLIFRDAKEHIIAKLPFQNLSIQNIMGATSKELIATKKRLFRVRDFPL